MKLLLISFIVIISITCHKSTDSYPDCFSDEVSSINISTSCFNLTTIAYMSSGKAVTIELNDSALHLSTTCSTYNIMEYPGDIVVKYYTYTPHPDSAYFMVCTDIHYRYYGHKTTWTAISGTVTAAVSKVQRQRFENYQASIRLDNVKFLSGNADTTISLLIKDKIVYGHIP